jgi:DnaJ-class molecular chaperone
MFWTMGWNHSKTSNSYSTTKKTEKKVESLDFEKTYEVPVFDLILGCKIEVKWVYGKKVKLKIAEWTKPWTRLRVKWLWKKEGLKIWNLIVKIEAKMPKNISEVDMHMRERIRENIGY